MSRYVLACLLFNLAVQTPAPESQPPANASPPADPAAVSFDTALGMLLVAVKPDRVTDYEAAIVALQAALAKSPDPETQKVAASWRVYKAAEADAKANALYVHVLQPAIAAADYRPSLWLDQLLDGAPAELLAKYRDAFAGPPSKLALVEFANMAVAPVTPPPGNESPSAPPAPEKPRNGSPPGPIGRR